MSGSTESLDVNDGSQDVRARFGHAIRQRRRELGFSQEELAGRAGLHRTYLADVERGSRNVGLCNIEKIARALQISLSSLFADYGVDK